MTCGCDETDTAIGLHIQLVAVSQNMLQAVFLLEGTEAGTCCCFFASARPQLCGKATVQQ